MANYSNQMRENVQKLLTTEKFSGQKMALSKTVENLEKEKIPYAIAGEAELYLQGLIDNFYSIDVLVEKGNLPKIVDLMNNRIGGIYLTGNEVSVSFQMGCVEVKFITRISFISFETSFDYELANVYEDKILVDDHVISVLPLEILYVIYLLMGESNIAEIVKDELHDSFLPDIFREILQKNNLPKEVKLKIEKFTE